MNILRSIVAGPRARHPEASLDLCYVTDKIIATSGPSATYPSLAYRNPLDQLVRFLDSRHGDKWCIWEFRAEGCGYPDSEVHNRIWHFPWPDHHPPPFALVPKIMASMRDWLHDESGHVDGRVAVVHCKAGKGRSGTVAISYLITHEGWSKSDALQRFTNRRMRPNFGAGISIPSQLRWINYVERWSSQGGRMYVERSIEVSEVHVWGLRDGVKISVEGYVEAGKKIKTFHVFSDTERDNGGDSGIPQKSLVDVVQSVIAGRESRTTADTDGPTPGLISGSIFTSPSNPLTNTIFRPSSPIILPTSDINIAAERRQGWKSVTSIAHVWFNCYFEGSGPENYAKSNHIKSTEGDEDVEHNQGSPWADDNGIFEINWEAMDGIKGSSRKGIRAFDRIAVLWKVVNYQDATSDQSVEAKTQESNAQARMRLHTGPSRIIPEPSPGEKVSPVEPADWRGSIPVASSNDLIGNSAEQGTNTSASKGKRDVQTGVAEEQVKHGETPTEGEGEGSESEDGAAGIRRGVSTNKD